MELAAASSKRMPLLLLLLAAIVGLGQCYHYAPITQKSPVWPFSAGDFDRRHDLLDFDDDDDDDDDRIDDYIAPFPPMSRFPRRHRLETVFQWSYLDWVRGAVERTGKNFTLGNPLTQDVDIDARGRVFVTSPQWLEGTPVTLSLVTNQNGPGGPLLTPYPDWTWHRADADCDSSIVSVYRVAIDECDRLWMVDTGSASGKAVCPAKILVFDLKRDELLLRYQIPAGQTVNNEASYVNPIVEVGKSCQDTYLYVADVLKHGILVYDMRLNRSWRLNNTASNAFGNDPEAGRITIEGESIDLTDGTLGMTLTPRGLFPKRYLYFNSLASFYQKVLEADSLKRSFVYEPIMYRSLAKRQSQAGVQAISKNGIMFFQLAEYTALACWNVRQPFKPENIVVVARIPRLLQYISGMKVLVNAQGHEELWFNTNRLQKTINNSRKINEINFRLIRGSVDDLVAGTRCQQNDASGAEFREQDWQRI